MFNALRLNHWKEKIVAGIGASLCIALLAAAGETEWLTLLMAPFGATMVILFGLPTSPLAQPKNIVFGHLITAAVGATFTAVSAPSPEVLGLATGAGVTLMLLSNTTHPPAGANPLLIILAGEDWYFVVTTILPGTLLIVLFGIAYHRLVTRTQYPTRN